MVLFKRKPVQYVQRPKDLDDSTDVWEIPQTEEIFTDYESYLNRMDFYKQTRFICQITGHSGLNFFEALKSELAGAQEVEEAFPEALKGPILRRVQFQTISRIDTLVDLIYDEFRANYYPGETVTVHVVSGEKLQGMVRDKTRFGAHLTKEGVMIPPFSRYFVTLADRPGEEAVVDDMHIARDRKIFTKQVLRSFIKKTVTREAWTGAPWLVRKEVADQYHIDQRIPPHLRYENKAAERKQKQQQQRGAQPGPDYEGMVSSFPGNGAKLPELKPAPKSHKSKQHQSQLAKSKQQPFLNPDPTQSDAPQVYYPLPAYPSPYTSVPPPPPPHPSHTFQAYQQAPGPQYATFRNGSFTFAPPQQIPPAPAPPPPIKYPIEDLQVPPRPETSTSKRPQLKYYSQDTPMDDGKTRLEGNGIQMKSVGLFLECWDTLNVYCEKFMLDSFTFDDFVEAMQFSSEDVECELLVEVHCAALKLMVDSEADGGAIKVALLGMDEDDDDDDEDEEEDESAAPTPTPEPEPQPKGRATRSSLAKAEAAALKAEAEAAKQPTPEPKIPHLAAEMQSEVRWVDRLRSRDFKNGGWQIILIGLLHHLSKNPRFFASCEVLLKELAPLHMPPTPDTARQQYAKLDVNHRIQALQILCMLSAHTKVFKEYMDECSDTMTGYRKEKIAHQRDRKMLLEELRLLNEERKIQLPANLPPSPALENKPLESKLLEVEDEVQESVDDEIMDTEDDVHQGRSLRRGNDRAANRKRKREVDQEKKDKAEAEAKLPKQTKQFTKLMKDIQKTQDKIKKTEAEIKNLDDDLREADCPRTKVLGKDRFWNRYYWFERNGMPFAGLPQSSTADAGYANGCIWVQGPDDLEREGYIDLKPEWEKEYRMKFNMTVPERKKMEEGATSVFNAREWGYYDDPDSVDALITWLDVRGSNELKLSKELKTYRDKIVEYMQKRKEYLNPTEDKSVESVSKRMSTRRKDQGADIAAHRCLQWHNLMALDNIGRLHSDPPRARKPTKKASRVQTPVVDEERPTKVEAKGKREKKGRH